MAEARTDPEFRIAAARILLDFRQSDASAAVAGLLGDERTRAAGLALANQVSLPELSDALLRGAHAASDAERSDWFAALGRSGSPSALSFLGGGAQRARDVRRLRPWRSRFRRQRRPRPCWSAPLRDPKTRRAALRASLVRKVALDRARAIGKSALAQLSGARDPSDRALFAQASVLFSPALAAEVVPKAALTELRAVSRLALLPEVSRVLAERLALESDPAAREALSACLVSSQAAERVPTDVLLDLLEAGGLAAPLAARALSARDSHTVSAPDLGPCSTATIRCCAATRRSAWGDSHDGSALGVLERAYRFETDETVRLAIVLALGARREPARLRVLRTASALDAARAVRQAAALALTGATAARDATVQTAPGSS